MLKKTHKQKIKNNKKSKKNLRGSISRIKTHRIRRGGAEVYPRERIAIDLINKENNINAIEYLLPNEYGIERYKQAIDKVEKEANKNNDDAKLALGIFYSNLPSTDEQEELNKENEVVKNKINKIIDEFNLEDIIKDAKNDEEIVQKVHEKGHTNFPLKHLSTLLETREQYDSKMFLTNENKEKALKWLSPLCAPTKRNNLAIDRRNVVNSDDHTRLAIDSNELKRQQKEQEYRKMFKTATANRKGERGKLTDAELMVYLDHKL